MGEEPNETEAAERDQETDYEEKDAPEPSISISTRGKSRKRAAPKSNPNKRPVKRGNIGKLEGLDKELPTEVVFLILSYLDPQTLISISRTNRQFRETLLSSDLFWKVSRQGAGMPDLEAQDITERQYLLLVFDKNCHACSKPNVHRINFKNCARLCSKCRQKTKVTPLQHKRLVESLHPHAEDCAKHTGEPGQFRWISRGIVKLSQRLHQMDVTEIERFVAERRLLKEQIARDAVTILEWMREQATNVRKEEETSQKAREDSIKEHLLALGWTDATLPKGWANESQVDQPRKLTPQIWKTIEAPLVKALRSALIESRNQLRVRAYRPHYLKLRRDDIEPDLFPSRYTFFTMPSMRPLWEKDQGPEPPAVELQEFVPFVEAEWLAALPDIRAAVAAYQQEMKDHAVQCLTLAYAAKHLPLPESPIDDPRSFFRYTPLWNPFGPQGDEVVLPFPAIHAAIRDHPQSPEEFKSVIRFTYHVVLQDV